MARVFRKRIHDSTLGFNTLRHKNGRHLADDIFNCIFLDEDVCHDFYSSLNKIRF